MEWAVFYDNDRIITSDDVESPSEVDPYGIVVIAQPDEMVGRQLMHGWDFYYYHRESGQWWGCDVWGLHDRLFSRLPMEAVCLGRTISSNKFQVIMEQAREFEGLPRKSATSTRETP